MKSILGPCWKRSVSEETKQHACRLFRQGLLDESRRITQKLLRINPDDPQLWLLDGLVCARKGQIPEAQASLNASLQRQKSYQALLSLGQVYLVAGDLEQAERYLAAAADCDCRPDTGEARITLGNLYANRGKYEQSLEIYQWLDDHGQADANVYGNMALTLEMLRRNNDARHAATKALRLEQYNPAAHLVLARLDRQSGNERESISRLRQAIAAHENTIDVAGLLGELGHALDRSGEYDDAFDAFRRANAIWQSVTRNAPYGKAFYLKRIEGFRSLLSGPEPDPAVDDDGDRLVFFVGFPRSGTTLVEQILRTRSNIVTTQEEPLVTNLISQLKNVTLASENYPAMLARLSDPELAGLRDRYLSELHRVTGGSNAGMIYVDKLPLNIIEAGFIHRLFPAARFLVALRDPRDVCLSCFMQSFRLNSAMVHFLDLEDTARFYSATMGLWNHYKSVFGGLRFLEYRYEDLIDDFDCTSKRILEFTGVEWTPDIRAYHMEAGASVVRTPSFIDVALPLYSRARGRWQHYASQIASIETILAPFIKQFGYTG